MEFLTEWLIGLLGLWIGIVAAIVGGNLLNALTRISKQLDDITSDLSALAEVDLRLRISDGIHDAEERRKASAQYELEQDAIFNKYGV